MKPAPFIDTSPTTVGEALAALANVDADGTVIASGHSLVPILTQEGEGDIRVGALCRPARVPADERVRSVCPIPGWTLRRVARAGSSSTSA
jgi:CO/xanthine dehydrogenase FAD-binding subunit